MSGIDSQGIIERILLRIGVPASDIATELAAIIAAIGSNVITSGTITTSTSASAVIDTSKIGATQRLAGCIFIPLTGAAALDRAIIGTFTTGTGGFVFQSPGLLAAPGTVAYVIIPGKSDNAQHTRDIPCADSAVADVTLDTSPSDVGFPDIVVAAPGAVGGIPLGAIVDEVHLGIICNTLDSSAAANYIEEAGDQIRVKIAAGAWGTNDIVAATLASGDWYTPASGMSSVVKIYSADIKAVVTGGAGTFNLQTDETHASTGIDVHGNNLVLKGVTVFFRFIYRMP